MKMKNIKTAKDYSSDFLNQALDEIPQVDYQKTTNKMLLAAKIADAIKAMGWSKTEFAEKIRCHKSEVTRWLSGTHNFTADTLFEIQAVLGITLISLEPEHTTLSSVEMHAVVKASEFPLIDSLIGRTAGMLISFDNLNFNCQLTTAVGNIISSRGYETKERSKDYSFQAHG